MTHAQAELYARLVAFSIDGPGPVQFPFVQRLAEENGWDRHFAARVVLEYKRFLFLAALGEKPVSPSDEVDQAWHLHLAYTKSYWQRLCGEVLPKPLHHNPTTGGAAELQKYRTMYAETLKLYEATFGETPPPDIWPPVAVRFSTAAEGRRIIPSKVWVIPRKPVYQALQYVALLCLLVLPLGCAGNWNPFDLKGMDFFYFYGPLLVLSFVWMIYYRRAAGSGSQESAQDVEDLSWAQVAYLSGEARVTTAAIARLMEQGKMLVDVTNQDQLIPVPHQAAPQHPVEARIHRSLPINRTSKETLKWFNDSVPDDMVNEIESLHEQGLIYTPGRAWQIVFVSVLPLFFCLLMVGLPRILMGLQTGVPTSNIIFITLLVTAIALVSLFHRPRVTPRGKAVLAELQDQHRVQAKVWRDADAGARSMATGLGLAVALYGATALTGTPLEELKKWYPHPTTDGGSSGAGCGTSGCGGGGGGGCGGGGCGGCGGGGD